MQEGENNSYLKLFFTAIITHFKSFSWGIEREARDKAAQCACLACTVLAWDANQTCPEENLLVLHFSCPPLLSALQVKIGLTFMAIWQDCCINFQTVSPIIIQWECWRCMFLCDWGLWALGEGAGEWWWCVCGGRGFIAKPHAQSCFGKENWLWLRGSIRLCSPVCFWIYIFLFWRFSVIHQCGTHYASALQTQCQFVGFVMAA